MALFPGSAAPDFITGTTAGPIRFHDWAAGCWRIVLTHPADYSARSLRAGLDWAHGCQPAVRLLGLRPVQTVADLPTIPGDDGRIAALWLGTASEAGPKAAPPVATHDVFLVDPANTIRCTLAFPPAAGQDFTAIIHMARAFGLGRSAMARARCAA